MLSNNTRVRFVGTNQTGVVIESLGQTSYMPSPQMVYKVRMDNGDVVDVPESDLEVESNS